MSGSVLDEQIRSAFLANGFTIREGQDDLKPYVFAAARALLALVNAQSATPLPVGGALDAEWERPGFEAWCKTRGNGAVRLKGTDQYLVPDVQAAWSAWQARAQQAGATPAVTVLDDDDMGFMLSAIQQMERLAKGEASIDAVANLFIAPKIRKATITDAKVMFAMILPRLRKLYYKLAAAPILAASASPAAQEDAPGAPPKQCWSANEEEFNHDSLGALIDANADDLKVGDTVWFADAVTPDTDRLYDTDDMFVQMNERAYDIAGEHTEDYPDVDQAATDELKSLLDGWIKKHAPPNFYEAKNVKPYVLTADDLA